MGHEQSIVTVWPSVAMFRLGQTLGIAYRIQAGPYIFTVGNLVALLSIPVALVLYLLRIAPGIGVRYRLTNRRVIVERGLRGVQDRAIELDRYDRLVLVVAPGHEWFDAGDLVFYRGDVEVFRLQGVSRPRAFRHLVEQARQAHVGVRRILEQQRQEQGEPESETVAG